MTRVAVALPPLAPELLGFAFPEAADADDACTVSAQTATANKPILGLFIVNLLLASMPRVMVKR
jgi:hypothetical protein